MEKALSIDIETRTYEGLLDLNNQWTELCDNTSLPVSSFLPSLTLGMLKHMPQYKDAKAYVFFAKEKSNSSPKLVGVFPYQTSRYRWLLPNRCYISMQNGFFGNGMPLIRSGYEVVVWEQFLDHLEKTPGTPNICYLERIACEGDSYRTLEKVLKDTQRDFYFTDQFERSAIHSELSHTEYIAEHYSKKSKKTASELRRQLRRLEELGTVQFEYSINPENNAKYLEQFLELENRGWKGQRGTSIACDAERVAMLKELINEKHNKPVYGFFVLTLDNKVIAIGLNYIQSGCLVTVKMAYDEEYRSYAPGLLLSWKTLELTLEHDDIKYINSNTIAGDVLEKIWKQRLEVGSIFFSVNKGRDSTFKRCMKLEETRLNARNHLKEKVNQIRSSRKNRR